MSNKSAPKKYKCTNCANEQWKKMPMCECEDVCSCSMPTCSLCKEGMVLKNKWNEYMMEELYYTVAQLIEYKEPEFEPKDTFNNHVLLQAINKIKLLKTTFQGVK